MNIDSTLRITVRVALAGVMGYAALAKIIDRNFPPAIPTMFSELSRSSVLHWVAIGAEGFIAIWLISGVATNAASVVVTALLSGFIGLLLMEMTRDRPLPCCCMGAAKVAMDGLVIRKSLRVDLIRDLLMLCAASLLFLLPRNAQPEIARDGTSACKQSENPK